MTGGFFEESIHEGVTGQPRITEADVKQIGSNA